MTAKSALEVSSESVLKLKSIDGTRTSASSRAKALTPSNRNSPRNLPMGFLVEVTQSDRIGEQLVQLLSHLQAHWLFEFQWQAVVDGSVRLNLPRADAESQLGYMVAQDGASHREL